tara:strand:+ start:702 stop:833 length:132 start_codon:yes stop_codon:yes gene_type:complete
VIDEQYFAGTQAYEKAFTLLSEQYRASERFVTVLFTVCSTNIV